VVFTLLALLDFEEAQRSSDTLVIVATWTISLSVLALAGPPSRWYARRLAAAQNGHGTLEELPELREA
jgi:hypothetical protein